MFYCRDYRHPGRRFGQKVVSQEDASIISLEQIYSERLNTFLVSNISRSPSRSEERCRTSLARFASEAITTRLVTQCSRRNSFQYFCTARAFDLP